MGIVKQFKTAEDDTLDLTTDEALAALLAEFDKAVESRKRANAAIEAIKAVVETKLGNHDNAVAKGCRMITWHVEPRREFTVKASNPKVLRIGKINGHA
jgi:hypothetical protein